MINDHPNYKSYIKPQKSFLITGGIEPDEILNSLQINPHDFYLLAEDYKIEEIRKLLKWLSFKPFKSKFRIAVIVNADQLTVEASNALLKTLEEPPEHASLILMTLCEQKILPTILSRCQKIRVLAPSKKDLPQDYIEISELAKMSVKKKFDWISQITAGEPAQINELLNHYQENFHKKMLAGEDVSKILKRFLRSRDLLMTNTSVKLVLENLFLEI